MSRKSSYQSATQELLNLQKKRADLGITGKAEVKVPLPNTGMTKVKVTPAILEKLRRT
jgi:hypothetical protein